MCISAAAARSGVCGLQVAGQRGVVLQGRGGRASSNGNGAAEQSEVIRAQQGVISNASVWDTMRLLPSGAAPQQWMQECSQTPQTGSFMHLHLGEPAAQALAAS